MSSGEAYATEVVDALATYLDAHGIATYDGGRAQSKPYTGEEAWIIQAGPRMPASPDQVVVLTPTNVVASRRDVAQGIQVRIRGAADSQQWDLDAQAQRITDLFFPGGHARSSFRMGALGFGRCDATYPQSIGEDASRRPESTLNLRFYARRVVRP